MFNNVDRYNPSIYSTTLNNYETYEYDNCCDSYNKQHNILLNSVQIKQIWKVLIKQKEIKI